jgi:hypothetical protein
MPDGPLNPEIIDRPQLPIEGLSIQQATDSKRVAFGGFLKPEMYDDQLVTPKIDISDDERKWFNVGKIKKILVGPVSYDEFQSDDRSDGVLLSSAERTALVRSPDMLARTAIDHTINASDDQTDERIAAAHRSSGHALEKKLKRMQEVCDGIGVRLLDIQELEKEAKSPGYAHKSPERMAELLSASWQELLNITDVLQMKRGWSDDQKMKFRQAAKDHLTTGSQRQRVKHWRELLQLQSTYLSRKSRIFKKQISKTQSVISDQEMGSSE